ncbi:phosphoglucosamine mutase [Candidatus Spongiihabitans sp.]|uniref:phosphoglucosamine mutase n=1 Tax=Candidatus Spongiihabitans sp. TaxID=3101308 RepID=UPI003C6FA804
MPDSLFGTDGVRGKVGEAPITPETVLKLGWAAGRVFAKSGRGDTVLIGKDTRVSGYMLESALEAGFSAAGVNISLLGPMPSPGIAYLTRTARACGGVVISASHNPYYDNGIKIFSSAGTKLQDSLVDEIDAMVQQPLQCVCSADLGKAKRFPDAYGRYIEHCKNTFSETKTLSGIKIVVDCANGAAYNVAPKVFAELGADVIAIANQPDGFNINERCGSTDLKALKKSVKKAEADIGIALDGDADRVLLIDRQGNEINGDQILYILAGHRKSQNRLHDDSNDSNGGIVGTLMTNLGLELALKKMSIPFQRTKVGDRYVHEALTKNHWNLGGEASGHIICLDKTTTGDGIVAALEVLEVMLETGKPVAELVKGMEIYPQHMINVPIGNSNGKKLANHKQVLEAVADVEGSLGRTGRVVLRPSGTESVFRVMIEGNNLNEVQNLTRQIAATIEQVAAS